MKEEQEEKLYFFAEKIQAISLSIQVMQHISNSNINKANFAGNYFHSREQV